MSAPDKTKAPLKGILKKPAPLVEAGPPTVYFNADDSSSFTSNLAVDVSASAPSPQFLPTAAVPASSSAAPNWLTFAAPHRGSFHAAASPASSAAPPQSLALSAAELKVQRTRQLALSCHQLQSSLGELDGHMAILARQAQSIESLGVGMGALMMGSARVFEAWEKEKEKSEEGADESRES